MANNNGEATSNANGKAGSKGKGHVAGNGVAPSKGHSPGEGKGPVGATTDASTQPSSKEGQKTALAWARTTKARRGKV